VLDYFRLSADHRLLFGGGDSHRPAPLPQVAAGMRRLMLQVFPQLADLPVSHVWGGQVDVSMNQAPDFGRLAPNVYYLQGFSGHGLALAGMAGRLVAEAVAGQAERFDLLARIKHRRFPGGPLRSRPATGPVVLPAQGPDRMTQHVRHATFAGRIHLIGLGSIGQAMLPLLLRHLDITPAQISVLAASERAAAVARSTGWNSTPSG
jgi:hypothetical protein